MPTGRDDRFAQLTWTRRLAAEMVTDAGRADDLAHDAWVQFLTRPPKTSGSQRAWFAQVMRNLLRQGWRRERLRNEQLVDELALAGTESTEDLVARTDAQRVLVEAVLELGSPGREAVLLKYWEGLDSPAIGQRLGMPASSVRTLLQRALGELRDALESRSGADSHDWLAAVAPLLTVGRPAPGAESSVVPTQLGSWSWAAALIVVVSIAVSYVVRQPDRAVPAALSAKVSDVDEPVDLTVPIAPDKTARGRATLDVEEALTVDDRSGQVPMSAAEAHLEPARSLRVTVVIDGELAREGTVWLNSSGRWFDAADAGAARQEPVDARGGALFEGLESSAATVGFQRRPGSTLVQRGCRLDEASNELTLAVGTARIEGRVWDADGQPAVDVEVQLGMRNGEDYGALRCRQLTDASGRFDFDTLLGTQYWLYADVAGAGGEVRSHGRLELGEIRTVELGAPVGRVRWSGRLIDEGGHVLGELDPSLEQFLEFHLRNGQGSDARFPAQVTAQGRYSVALVPGEYDVYRLLDEGSSQSLGTGLVVTGAEERDLVLRGVRVEGVATRADTGTNFDPNVDGRCELQLRLETEGRAKYQVVAVGPEGRFAFEGLAPGRWWLEGDRLAEDPLVLLIGSGDRERIVDVVVR